MDGQNEQLYQEWSGRQWAAEDPAQDHDSTQLWTADEWVGDQGHGVRTPHRTAAEMARGQRGLSGFGHTGGVSHWAPAH